jgi:hypothetical protein
MVRLAPVARLERLLNFIGSMSGPVTMKSPLISRMVSTVIAALPLFQSLLLGTIGILRALQLKGAR